VKTHRGNRVDCTYPNLKGLLPFRLGTTSCILPEGLVENATFLAPLADDIELVLFDLPEVSNLPDETTVGRLADLKARYDLSYTVHLPMDLRLGDADDNNRKQSVAKVKEIAVLTAELDPFAFIVHFDNGRRGRKPADDMDKWVKALGCSMDELLDGGIQPGLLCIETLDYPFDYVEEVILRRGLSVCLDIGHLVVGEYDVPDYLERYGTMCRVVHLHGIRDGEDHRDIEPLPLPVFDALEKELCNGSGINRVVTLEVFSVEDYHRSMEIMKHYVEAGVR
jgi:sugar phosphate isomerase/epimerase